MLKTAMFVSAIAMSAPVFAQDAQTTPQTPSTTQPAPQDAPTPPQGAPIAGAPVTSAQTTTPADPASPAPAQDVAAAPAEAVAPAEVAAAPAQPAAATPVTGASQIAQVVSTEFPTYDKNGDKNLDKTEFGAWMVALKTASDPATKAGDPATVKWVSGAFASADTDRSKKVSQAELTKYLSQSAG